MDFVVCPHCQAQRSVGTSVPKEVVVVMPCPSCKEWAVVYRNKVVALKREVLTRGSRKARILHLAEVLAEFLDSGVLPTAGLDPELRAAFGESADEDYGDDYGEEVEPISDHEFEKFTKIDLKCLDNASYFRRHFG